MKLEEYLERGDLAGLTEAATAAVREKPLDPAARMVLAEVLCLAGDFDRAEKLAVAAGSLRKEPTPGIALLRNLLRAEVAREQFFREGRPPELRWEPADPLSSQMEVVVDLRGKREDAAAAALARSTVALESVAGVARCRDRPELEFSGFRDLDDRTATVIEAFSAAGKYYCLPWTQVKSLKFEPLETLRDLIWRPTTMQFTDGGEGRYFMPALYVLSAGSGDPAIQLGQSTIWSGLGGDLTGGAGQRMFLAGEETLPILEIEEISFHQPVS